MRLLRHALSPAPGRAEVDDWFEQKTVVFVLALGRSGTALIAHLLDAAPRARFEHEPVLLDWWPLTANMRGRATDGYIEGFRLPEIYRRVHDEPIDVYGEVNSLLRRHGIELRDALPSARLLHLVRDGRDVVRSALARSAFTRWDPTTWGYRPPGRFVSESEWATLGRFERVCWYWRIENALLEEACSTRVTFERIVTDYGYVDATLLKPHGLHLTQSDWQRIVARPVNATPERKRRPHWRTWPSDHKELFETICGDAMTRYGYTLDWE